MERKKRILAVDDDDGILEVIGIILRDNGYEVETVNNGLEVEKAIEQFRPDLVMLDLLMPQISGEELCRRIKSGKSTNMVPVILLSASNRTAKISHECQADDYLAKPFDMEELLDKVSKLI